MIITTKRRPLQHFFDIVLTALGWIAFVIMFGAGILALLRDEVRGPDALFLPSSLADSISTVAGYVLLMLGFTVFLIVWAKYNQHRFAGVDRRKPPAPLEAVQLCASFGVSEKQFDDMQAARFIAVAHDDDGAIVAVRTVDEELKLRANRRGELPAQVTVISTPEVEASETVDVKLKQPSRQWFFLDPQSSIRYMSGHSWANQLHAYKRTQLVFGGKLSIA